jgi:NAD(P)-dependent dehydrogenase (short-subunit alcohol dehydrogenase family)
MILDLTGKKVVVLGGKQSVGHAIAEAVARKGADVVIWLRKCNDDLNKANVSPMTDFEIPPATPNGAPQISLWRQTIARKATGDQPLFAPGVDWAPGRHPLP